MRGMIVKGLGVLLCGALLCMAAPVGAASYYNSMLLGSDRSIKNCNDVYERLRGYEVVAIKSCGYGVDASCNKRIRYDGEGGIDGVRRHFNTVLDELDLNKMDTVVNSKGSCVF